MDEDIIIDFSELNETRNEDTIQDICDAMNQRIMFADEKITIRESLEAIGVKTEHLYPHGSYVDQWGWDRKGFRQLYKYELIPVD